MPPPTPAAVRAALKNGIGPLSVDESREYRADPRPPDYLLRDHIRAVCAEMRERAVQAEAATSAVSAIGAEVLHNYANDLRVFANKLEGREP